MHTENGSAACIFSVGGCIVGIGVARESLGGHIVGIREERAHTGCILGIARQRAHAAYASGARASCVCERSACADVLNTRTHMQ